MKKFLLAGLLLFAGLALLPACEPVSPSTPTIPQTPGTDQEKPSESGTPSNPDQPMSDTIFISIGNSTKTIKLVENSTAEALLERLKQGCITYTANDYGGFEKVGDLGFSLPRNDESIDTVPGDVILYMGSSLCLYYGANSWDFTRIGKIVFDDVADLKTFLHAGKGSIAALEKVDTKGRKKM